MPAPDLEPIAFERDGGQSPENQIHALTGGFGGGLLQRPDEGDGLVNAAASLRRGADLAGRGDAMQQSRVVRADSLDVDPHWHGGDDRRGDAGRMTDGAVQRWCVRQEGSTGGAMPDQQPARQIRSVRARALIRVVHGYATQAPVHRRIGATLSLSMRATNRHALR